LELQKKNKKKKKKKKNKKKKNNNNNNKEITFILFLSIHLFLDYEKNKFNEYIFMRSFFFLVNINFR